jgi:DNA (cytosine-5)-methyltransferase 1
MWGDRAPHTINQEWLSTAGGKFVPDTLVGALAVPRVRRITPRECERLQGFPDDYTLVAHKGKPAADGNRYKAIGNSMAVNVMRWIGTRIEARG